MTGPNPAPTSLEIEAATLEALPLGHPAGAQTCWTVHETIRKGFHLHSSEPVRL